MMRNLQKAAHHLPEKRTYKEEATPLIAILEHSNNKRRRGPAPIGEVLPLLLARLGVGNVQSTTEEQEPAASQDDA